MTKIRETGNSSMIDDRRGQSSGGRGGGFAFPGLGGRSSSGGGLGFPLKAGGGLIGLVLTLAVVLLPKLLGGVALPSSNALAPVTGQNTESSGATCDDELESILCGATIDVQTFWQRNFESRGETYEVTKTVFFSGSTDTGCGQASSQTGPFYCPSDHLVYFDLDFLVQLQDQFGAQGDLASAYIVAHEYGHHVQNLLGINAKVRQAQQNDPDRANQYSVALELQADCLAGIWARDAAARSQFDSEQEISEAVNAAAAVGDDRIQQTTQGRVNPETFTHGTSEQRVSWFNRGYGSGDLNSCNTFDEVVGS